MISVERLNRINKVKAIDLSEINIKEFIAHVARELNVSLRTAREYILIADEKGVIKWK